MTAFSLSIVCWLGALGLPLDAGLCLKAGRTKRYQSLPPGKSFNQSDNGGLSDKTTMQMETVSSSV